MSVQLTFRASDEQAALFKKLARKAGVPLAVWIREVLLRSTGHADLSDLAPLQKLSEQLEEAK